MDEATSRLLSTLAPYVVGASGFIISIWTTIYLNGKRHNAQQQVMVQIDGRMTQLAKMWGDMANAKISANQAHGMQPEVIADAAAKVIDAADAARAELKKDHSE
ncbi:MAG TPA: hypothetical protein VIO57_10165 [Chloroflexota bacterium]|jgi:hypothetical protein